MTKLDTLVKLYDLLLSTAVYNLFSAGGHILELSSDVYGFSSLCLWFVLGF